MNNPPPTSQRAPKPSAPKHLLTTIHYPPSTTIPPPTSPRTTKPSAPKHLLTTNHHPLSTIHYPLSTTIPPSASVSTPAPSPNTVAAQIPLNHLNPPKSRFRQPRASHAPTHHPLPTTEPPSASVSTPAPSSDTPAAAQIPLNHLNPPKLRFRQPRASRPTIHYPLSTIHCLSLFLALLLLSACGRRPTAPTPLPPGTPVAQPTPDFSAPAQPDSVTDSDGQPAQALRTRLAQQRTLPTPTPAVSPEVPQQFPRSSPSLDPSLDVFNRPNALGILAGGGVLYAAPGGAARANLQVGATLTITGRSADSVWFAAYLADGTAGWVPAAQVRVFGDAAELEVVQESLGPAIVATLIAQASQPQEPLSAVVARLTPTASEPLTPEVTPAVSPALPPAVPLSLTVIVEGANLRAGPGTDYPVVGGLNRDATAALLGRNESGDWLQIQLPDRPAWIFAPLVETTVPIADLPTVAPPPSN